MYIYIYIFLYIIHTNIYIYIYMKTPWRKLSLVCRFNIALAYKYTACVPCWSDVETTWKRRVRVVLAWNAHGVFVGTLLEISSPLMSFENFNSFFYAIN